MDTATDKQVESAIDQTRSTAKWIIAAFAAVGASLIAGLQITGLGKLEGQDLALAVAGLAVALSAVITAIVLVGRVLTPPLVLLDEVKEQVGDLVEADRTLLKGQAGDLPTLLRRYETAYDDYVRLWTEAEKHPEDNDKRELAEAVGNELDGLEDAVNWLRSLALSQKVRKAFTGMLGPLIIIVAFAAAGVAAFAYASNRPEAKAESTPHTSKAVGQTPVGVAVRLSRDERALLAPRLGRHCGARGLQALAIGGRPVALDVVTLPTARCRSVRVVVTPKAGIVVHRSPAPRVGRLERIEAR